MRGLYIDECNNERFCTMHGLHIDDCNNERFVL